MKAMNGTGKRRRERVKNECIREKEREAQGGGRKSR
jgi:hypothetical protein